MKTRNRLLIISLLLLSLTKRDLIAAIRTSSQSGNWTSSATWGGNPAPAAGDTVVINGAFTVTVDASGAACALVQLGGTASGAGAGTLSFNAGARLTVESVITVGSGNNPGSLVMSGGGTLVCAGFIFNNLGTWTPGTGSVEITASDMLPGGGIITFNNLMISAGTTSLDGNLEVTGNLVIGPGAQLSCGVSALTLDGQVTGVGSLTSGSTGTVVYNQGSPGQSVFAAAYGNLSFSDYAKTLPSTGIVGIAGSFSPGIATGHSVAGSTVDFNGGPQTVPAFPYNNLSVSVNGIKTGPPALTITGTLLVRPGVIFMGVTSLTLNGATDTVGGTLNASTLIVGSGGTLTNNGTVSAVSSLTGPGTITQGISGLLYIGGTVDIATFNVTTPGNTVAYSGTSQAVRPALYHNLMIGNFGAPTIAGISVINGNLTLMGGVITAVTGLTIGGDFAIQAGSFVAGTYSHIVRGNFSNSGTLTPGTSTFTMNGAAPQSIGGVQLNTLVINNPAGVSLSADVSVLDSLQLTAGIFSIGPHTLTLNGSLSMGAGSLIGMGASSLIYGGSGGAATLPGITLGKLTWNRPAGLTLAGNLMIDSLLTVNAGSLVTGADTVNIAPGGYLSESPGHTIVGHAATTQDVTGSAGTYTCGNIGLDFVFPGNAYVGVTIVRRTTGTASTGTGHSSLRRYFDITSAAPIAVDAGVMFHFDQNELSGQNPAALELYESRDTGATWQNEGGVANTGNRTVFVPGLWDLWRFTVSDTNNRLGNTPTPLAGSLVPSASDSGGPGFTLDVIMGRDYLAGKSTVRFNGSDRPTTFADMGILHASIPATDLLVPGGYPVTVFNAGGGGLSGVMIFTVRGGGEVSVGVETSPDGLGVVVPARTLGVGEILPVYAVARATGGRFMRNVLADAWSLQDITGAVAPGDLGITWNGASLRGNGLGSAVIKATYGNLTPIPSGAITVVPPASVADVSIPLTYALMQNFPNPFNPSTEIKFDLPFAGNVSLIVYDILGQKVTSLAGGHFPPGHHSVTWKASGQASGMYIYRLQAGDGSSDKTHSFVAAKCLLLVR